MALVFQDYSRSLYPWMTVAANVEFPLRRKPISKHERRRPSSRRCDSVGLDGFADKYPWQLSGGMQQRVAIARGLAYRPEILLMDEPFASVDAQTRADLEDLVLRIRHDYGVTILFVTHDIDESVYLADRVVILSPRPTVVQETLEVPLPRPRDQVTTKELPEFAQLRAHVYRAIKRTGRRGAGACRREHRRLSDAARADRDRRAVAGRAAGRGGDRGAAGLEPRDGPHRAAAPGPRRARRAHAQPRRPRAAGQRGGGGRDPRGPRGARIAGGGLRRRTAHGRRGARADRDHGRDGAAARRRRAARDVRAQRDPAPAHRRDLAARRRTRHLHTPAIADRALPVPHGARAGALAAVAGRAPRDRRRDHGRGRRRRPGRDAAHLSNVAATLSDIASE